MCKKCTIEDIREFAKKEGYEVLDDTYVNSKSKMKFKCSKCGYIMGKSFNNFKKNKNNCTNCKNIELNENWDSILNNIIEYCKLNNKTIPLSQLKSLGVFTVSINNVNNIIKRKGYENYKDFCNKHNICDKYIINDKFITENAITIKDLKDLWDEYNKKYGIVLGVDICNKNNKEWNIPTWSVIQNILKKNNITLDEFYDYAGIKHYQFDVSKYDMYLESLIEIFEKQGELTYDDLNNNKYGIPSIRWFIRHCPNDKVTNYNEFTEWLGFKSHTQVNKEEAIKIIYDMQSKQNHPLMYDDFRNPKVNKIGIALINKYWGTMNNMKKELGLIINQEDMIVKHKTLEESKTDIIKLCNHIYSTENRKTILSTDTNKIDGLLDFYTYGKYFKENNLEIREFISSLGFELQKGGLGLNHTFNDGERVSSNYEYEFSKYLKNKLHLEYNKNYFRDIRYSTFIEGYKELMNCDYIINYNGRTIYIEIAGMLNNLHNYYYNNKTIIQSETKENYRQKLMQKEEMLKSVNVEYYILFPINKNYQSVLDWDLINRIFLIKLNCNS